LTQIFKVTIDGKIITDSVESCGVNYTLGNIVNTANMIVTFDPALLLGKSVEIVQGNNTFMGIVRAYQKTTNLKYNLDCASLGGKLSEPYFVNTDGIARSVTATQLCGEYSQKSGVPISYNAVDIDFGGSWIETGTPDNELMKMAAVIGADIRDDGNGIIIENVKAVTGDPVPLGKNDILEILKVSDTIINNGLVFVTTITSNARAEA
jgi:hypothetical protein